MDGNSFDEIIELFNEPINARNLNRLFDTTIDDDSLIEFERLFKESMDSKNLDRMMEIIMPTSSKIDSSRNNIINMPISISDFPSDGIIYTADAVMFHRDAIKRWLPMPSRERNNQLDYMIGSRDISSDEIFDLCFSNYIPGPLANPYQLRDMIGQWWRNDDQCWGLAGSIIDSAIAYKPAEDQQLYLFNGNGGFYVIQCKDAMDYLSMIRSHKLLFDRKPLAQAPDQSQLYEDNLHNPVFTRLAQQGIKLVSRGHKIWLAVGPTDGMQEKLIAAFNPPPVAKPAPPKVYMPGPSHA